MIIASLLISLVYLITIRALCRKLDQERSDHDVATALLEDRNTRITALERNLQEWRDLADGRARELNDFKVKCDNLTTEKIKAEKDRDYVVGLNARLNGELRRKHRRVIVE